MKFSRLLKIEFEKYWQEIKAYYPDHIVGIIVTFIFFYAFFVAFSGLTDTQNLYVGFFYWFFASTVISEGSVSISYEKQVGTFEQLYLKPTSLLSILTARTIIWMTISFIKMILLLPILFIILNIELQFSFYIIPIFIITMIGLYGFGLLLSSLTLLYTKTASFESIISYIFLFFTGAIIPTTQFPEFLTYFSKFIPLSIGIDLSKSAIINGFVDLTEMLFLLINSLVYLLLGLFFYYYVIKKVKKMGLSSKY